MNRILALLLCLTIAGPAGAYEICTAENDYLEEDLPNFAPETPSELSAACIERAQLNLKPTGYYGYCPTPEGMPGRTHPRPCISERYVRTVHAALLDVSDCLGYDPRWAFASFNLESALHINAVGGAGDVGVGQLTKAAIDQVNARARAVAEEIFRRSSRPSCRRLAGYAEAESSAPQNRCGFMTLPENPRRNLIYSILLLQENRKMIERYFQRYNLRFPAGVQVERLKKSLSKLAYNSGAAGLVATLRAYLDQMGSQVGDHDFHFENFEAVGFAAYLGRHFPIKEGQESVRKRVSKYMSFVAISARRVDRQLGGGVCLSPDMFPPLGPHPLSARSDLRPVPSAVRARQFITKYIEEMADDSEAVEMKSCREARAQFLFEFLPARLKPSDLPENLYRRWRNLCHDKKG